ncbi:uncharacterized protein AMSG_11972 [Thecamonas trahens ATCC 50062]|uniref:USP domain-containing protein n=1 Tax=Thecamonas trahens ATCC 50062 TaxID=461836 RepID=A0A0L0DFW0_THETB|nr:hypothetical protein AMSG_11972 [Thecamonas trahens ATCC 50062]KNC50218.1 hypothetical protein AMSG_11972 [Thecamonas trahens ATCC 50062]|eukprot:XP_013757129.1 hypothetical protein AMSG_11972 [Thecamonas trahens ATCC 50062]
MTSSRTGRGSGRGSGRRSGASNELYGASRALQRAVTVQHLRAAMGLAESSSMRLHPYLLKAALPSWLQHACLSRNALAAHAAGTYPRDAARALLRLAADTLVAALGAGLEIGPLATAAAAVLAHPRAPVYASDPEGGPDLVSVSDSDESSDSDSPLPPSSATTYSAQSVALEWLTGDVVAALASRLDSDAASDGDGDGDGDSQPLPPPSLETLAGVARLLVRTYVYVDSNAWSTVWTGGLATVATGLMTHVLRTSDAGIPFRRLRPIETNLTAVLEAALGTEGATEFMVDAALSTAVDAFAPSNDLRERLSGLTTLVSFVEALQAGVAPERVFTPPVPAKHLLDVLERGKVVEGLFGVGFHSRLIAPGFALFRFLAEVGKLEPAHLSSLWAAVTGKHESVRSTLFDGLLSLVPCLSRAEVDVLYPLIVATPPGELDALAIEFVAQFAALVAAGLAARAEASLAYGLDYLWSLIIEPGSVSAALVAVASDAFVGLLSQRVFLARRKQYLEAAIGNVTAGRSVPASLRFFVSLLKTFPASGSRFTTSASSLIKTLNDSHDLLGTLLDNAVTFATMPGAELPPPFSRAEHVAARLDALYFILLSSSLTMTKAHVDAFWRAFVTGATCQAERAATLEWLHRTRVGRCDSDSSFVAFDEKVSRYVFQSKMLDTMDVAWLNPPGYALFQRYFVSVNTANSSIELVDDGTGSVPYRLKKPKKAVGLPYLWDIILLNQDDEVWSLALDCLASLYHNIPSRKRKLRASFYGLAIQHLGNAPNEGVICRVLAILIALAKPESSSTTSVGGANASPAPLRPPLALHIVAPAHDPPARFRIRARGSLRLGGLRTAIARRLNLPSWSHSLLKLVSGGRELAPADDQAFLAELDLEPAAVVYALDPPPKTLRAGPEALASAASPRSSRDAPHGVVLSPLEVPPPNSSGGGGLRRSLSNSSSLSEYFLGSDPEASPSISSGLSTPEPMFHALAAHGGHVLTSPENFAVFASLLSHSEPVAKLTLELLSLVPTNATKFAAYEAIMRDSNGAVLEWAADPDDRLEFTPAQRASLSLPTSHWAELFPSDAPWVLLYSLRLVCSILDSDDEPARALAWSRAFVVRGGVSWLVNILVSVLLTPEAQHSAEWRSPTSHILRVLTTLGIELHDVSAHSLRRSLAAVIPTATLPASVEAGTMLAQQTVADGELPVLRPSLLAFADIDGASLVSVLLDIVRTEAGGSSEHSADAVRVADTMSLLLGLALADPGLAAAWLETPDLGGWLEAAVVRAEAPSIRAIVAHRVHQLAAWNGGGFDRGCDAASPQQLFLNLVVDMLPAVAEAPAMAAQYFVLFRNLIDDAGHTSGTSLADLIDVADVVEQLLSFIGPERSDAAPACEAVAVGVFSALAALMRSLPEVKAVDGPRVLELVMGHCLFGVEGELPHCKTAEARRAGFALVIELARGCSTNLGMLLRTVQQCVSAASALAASSWAFEPRKLARDGCGYVGLINLGATCYMNATLQQLFCLQPLRDGLLSAVSTLPHKAATALPVSPLVSPLIVEPSPAPPQPGQLLFRLQHTFAALALSQYKYWDTSALMAVMPGLGGEPLDVAVQQDANEFLNVLFDSLETALKGTPQAALVSSLFAGRLTNQILSQGCEHTSERDEPFYTLSLEIKNKANLAESLELFVQGEMLDGANQYKCSACDAHVDAIKRLVIADLPPVLVLHLKRFDFDLMTLTRTKINSRLAYPHELDMAPYMIEDPEREPGATQYQLRGVLVHLGSADSGHYYSFIRTGSAEWFEFNDTLVEPFDARDLPDATFGGERVRPDGNRMPATYSAYMLFYERVGWVPPAVASPTPARPRVASAVAAAAAAAAGGVIAPPSPLGVPALGFPSYSDDDDGEIEGEAYDSSDSDDGGSGSDSSESCANDGPAPARSQSSFSFDSSSDGPVGSELPPRAVREGTAAPANMLEVFGQEMGAANAELVRVQSVFNREFYGFMWDMLHLDEVAGTSAGGTTIELDSLRLPAGVLLGTEFVLFVLAHDASKPLLNEWVEHLRRAYSGNQHALLWWLRLLAQPHSNLLESLFLRCPVDGVRRLVVDLTRAAVSTVADGEDAVGASVGADTESGVVARGREWVSTVLEKLMLLLDSALTLAAREKSSLGAEDALLLLRNMLSGHDARELALGRGLVSALVAKVRGRAWTRLRRSAAAYAAIPYSAGDSSRRKRGEALVRNALLWMLSELVRTMSTGAPDNLGPSPTQMAGPLVVVAEAELAAVSTTSTLEELVKVMETRESRECPVAALLLHLAWGHRGMTKRQVKAVRNVLTYTVDAGLRYLEQLLTLDDGYADWRRAHICNEEYEAMQAIAKERNPMAHAARSAHSGGATGGFLAGLRARMEAAEASGGGPVPEDEDGGELSQQEPASFALHFEASMEAAQAREMSQALADDLAGVSVSDDDDEFDEAMAAYEASLMEAEPVATRPSFSRQPSLRPAPIVLPYAIEKPGGYGTETLEITVPGTLEQLYVVGSGCTLDGSSGGKSAAKLSAVQEARAMAPSGSLLDAPISELKLNLESRAAARLAAELEELEAEAQALREGRRGRPAARWKKGRGAAPESALWVDHYAPTKFRDLLSDDRINRRVLHWIKEWDPLVFKRHAPKAPTFNDWGRKLDKGKAAGFKAFSDRSKSEGRGGSKERGSGSGGGSEPPGRGETLLATRPYHKVLLLAGPPGLGKTSMAHVLAKMAGYNVVEINASDDRTAAALKLRIYNAMEMQSMFGPAKPNLIVVDEIDGSMAGEAGAIGALVDIATSSKRPQTRPIIAICNNQYVPAMYPLRKIAQTFTFRKPPKAKLTRRLGEICEAEGLVADAPTLTLLVNATEADIRACVNALQFVATNTQLVTPGALEEALAGTKDIDRSLFDVWTALFTLPTKKTEIAALLAKRLNRDADAMVTSRRVLDPGMAAAAALRDASSKSRVGKVVALVNSVSGEMGKLIDGLHENFLDVPFNDPNLDKTLAVLNRFGAYDQLMARAMTNASFALVRYVPYVPAYVHMVCAAGTAPHLTFPYMARTAARVSREVAASLDTMYRGLSPALMPYYPPHVLMQDVLSALLDILAPRIRPAGTLSSMASGDRALLDKVAAACLNYGLKLEHVERASGKEYYNFVPPIHTMAAFTFANYFANHRPLLFGVQALLVEAIAEVASARKAAAQRAAAPFLASQSSSQALGTPAKSGVADVAGMDVAVPTPSPIRRTVARDFFGRELPSSPITPLGGEPGDSASGSGTKRSRTGKPKRKPTSAMFYRFQEGTTNAVRRTFTISELLTH